ncbi:hypothetical protein R5W24_004597 [Gemmata sp. JC717]|uniref:hypothetical protein n=1 Tax=Gemmata algarum TaxID=2975278 RepID=UPI0021BB4037|nr:hypothetical protein [Gemmata algarum]MDY3555454.1 hypothetical protein [Gemmata algarum]
MTQLFRALALATVAGLVGGCGSSTDDADKLTGRVTIGGQPAKDVTVVAIGPDRTEASALTGPNGEYALTKPPRGALRFRVTALVPPPPAGVQAPPPPPGTVTVPAKYAKPDNELVFTFDGGHQTYDLELKR